MIKKSVITAIFLFAACINQLVECPDSNYPNDEAGLMDLAKEYLTSGLQVVAKLTEKESNLPKREAVTEGIKAALKMDGSEIALSMSGSAFLLGYHFGVAEAYIKLAKDFFGKIKYFAGTSGGSLVAMLLAYCDQNDAELKQCQDLINKALVETYHLVNEMNGAGHLGTVCSAGIWMYDVISEYITGLFSRQTDIPQKLAKYSAFIMRSCMKKGFPLFNKLANILEKVVPLKEQDFNRIKENRLFISMSKLEKNKKKTAHKVSKFVSRRHQILCNLASSFIDVFGYMGNDVEPVEVEPKSGVRYVDGFYTDQLPLVTIPGKKVWTMTVSPFAAEAVISPHDKIMKYVFQLNVFRIYVNKENLDRLGNSVIPTIANLMAYRKQGFRDALKFLAENNFTDTKGIRADQYDELVNEHIQGIGGN